MRQILTMLLSLLFLSGSLTACGHVTPPPPDKTLADEQTKHPEPPARPYDQRKVGVFLLKYERQLDQCRAKLGVGEG